MTTTKDADTTPAITSFYFFEAHTKLNAPDHARAVEDWASEVARQLDVKYTLAYRDDAWRAMFENLPDGPAALNAVKPAKFGLG
jgi:hypothetical protein